MKEQCPAMPEHVPEHTVRFERDDQERNIAAAARVTDALQAAFEERYGGTYICTPGTVEDDVAWLRLGFIETLEYEGRGNEYFCDLSVQTGVDVPLEAILTPCREALRRLFP